MKNIWYECAANYSVPESSSCDTDGNSKWQLLALIIYAFAGTGNDLKNNQGKFH